ncbi:hypothetical protein PRIPAC_88191 [Pristionchus pacificus]|uniref:Uncharacterized protein n=1 Tax=Pristionchus pacificus TaxID=54126 RepID=A0A2A6B8C0_PRIPA|nr:hypothetical protein PRIPAC_88191 [Pristionchus pacificus]|eukprot:PDM62115.1 hypothetical protein PRIPAC_51557 [Pristionchus pacificus]
MIGMINLPTEGPVDFYAAPVQKHDDSPPRLQRIGRPTALANLGSLPEVSSSSSKPPPSPATREKYRFSLGLFSQRKRQPSHGYCADGRKCQDGRPINAANPSKLWDELFMRKMVNKIQDEIASPVDHLNSMEKTFGRMAVLNQQPAQPSVQSIGSVVQFWKSFIDRQTSRSEPNLCSEDKSTSARFCEACSAAIDAELAEKKSRANSDLVRNEEDKESESALDDLMSSNLLTPPMSSAPGSTQNLLCNDCS